ncbi:MAG: 50S ribosomal protein L32 [Candidatus Zambryskibacteria bacterium RIFCSPLOWO2_01_FULL_35_19]|uniref:Large ribosomal subunit protein bL32 n=1 Tax=Candidatus Zambryskibacteria bacterium RIFCSPLOWO2_01_FULL_35_19 TaxID=1802757 RepID=A0A1G2TV31_9BACT|nr:MAG: 50S ribosomal protein L32 [Candidatus Zambryskibacteria bacterium RIFCSPHIGHO2_01_FULL_35_32]OHB01146.1 MAG: 50S ribosomal protein L32 [Candidatus Zambryskibacteria bacterium RIFCSPLOWO2_01_FULL_35_19]
MVIRMRHTRAHTANRRSHHALETQSLNLCKECGSPKAPHLVCQVCGKYKGKQILDVHSKIIKKENKAKEKAKQAKK